MKKLLKHTIMVMLCMLLFLVGGCTGKNNKDESLTVAESRLEQYFDTITYEEFGEQKREMTGIVYFGRPSCIDCSNFEADFFQEMKGEKKHQITYLNVHDLKQEKESWEKFVETHDVRYTPTFIKYKDGKEISRIEWTPENGLEFQSVIVWLAEQEG